MAVVQEVERRGFILTGRVQIQWKAFKSSERHWLFRLFALCAWLFLFLKIAQAGGRTWDRFGFSFIFCHKQRHRPLCYCAPFASGFFLRSESENGDRLFFPPTFQFPIILIQHCNLGFICYQINAKRGRKGIIIRKESALNLQPRIMNCCNNGDFSCYQE